jgi:hypothetical protein
MDTKTFILLCFHFLLRILMLWWRGWQLIGGLSSLLGGFLAGFLFCGGGVAYDDHFEILCHRHCHFLVPI